MSCLLALARKNRGREKDLATAAWEDKAEASGGRALARRKGRGGAGVHATCRPSCEATGASRQGKKERRERCVVAAGQPL